MQEMNGARLTASNDTLSIGLLRAAVQPGSGMPIGVHLAAGHIPQPQRSIS